MALARFLTLSALGAIAVVIGLSGCSAPALDAEAKPTITVPAIDPGPVALSEAEAGDRYLSIVCPINIATNALNAAYAAGEDEYLNGGTPDVSAVVAAATTIRDQQRLAIEQLDDTYFEWPGVVAEQAPHIRSAYMANMAVVSAIAGATDFETAYSTPAAASTPEEDAAGQEIRYQLGLSADTDASCAGFEDGLTTLSTAKTERDAALSKQD